jgi:hypothetical protein
MWVQSKSLYRRLQFAVRPVCPCARPRAGVCAGYDQAAAELGEVVAEWEAGLEWERQQLLAAGAPPHLVAAGGLVVDEAAAALRWPEQLVPWLRRMVGAGCGAVWGGAGRCGAGRGVVRERGDGTWGWDGRGLMWGPVGWVAVRAGWIWGGKGSANCTALTHGEKRFMA